MSLLKQTLILTKTVRISRLRPLKIRPRPRDILFLTFFLNFLTHSNSLTPIHLPRLRPHTRNLIVILIGRRYLLLFFLQIIEIIFLTTEHCTGLDGGIVVVGVLPGELVLEGLPVVVSLFYVVQFVDCERVGHCWCWEGRGYTLFFHLWNL